MGTFCWFTCIYTSKYNRSLQAWQERLAGGQNVNSEICGQGKQKSRRNDAMSQTRRYSEDLKRNIPSLDKEVRRKTNRNLALVSLLSVLFSLLFLFRRIELLPS